MKRALAVIVAILVSIIWLGMIVGIPALAYTGMLEQVVPAELRQWVDLDNLDTDRIAQLLEGELGITLPGIVDEPDIVIETPTPELPTPEPPVEPTPTLEPTPLPVETPTPAVDLTATAEAAEANAPTLEITPTNEITVTQTVTVASIGNVRAGPGTDFDIVGTVDANASVQVVGQDDSGEWFLLDDGTWIFGGLLVELPDFSAVAVSPEDEATPDADGLPAPPVADTPVVATTTVNAASNLRAGPGTNFEIVAGLAPGDSVTLVGRYDQDNWYLLDNGNWIFGTLLADPPQNLPVVNAQGTIISGPGSGEAAVPTDDTPDVLEDPDDLDDPDALEDTAAPPVTAPTDRPTVNTTANLRSGPGTNFTVVGSVTVGTRVAIVGRNQAGNWFRLIGGEWISASLIDNPPADVPVVANP
jgi:uncharacterized protein YgiM (DUF1202 family)